MVPTLAGGICCCCGRPQPARPRLKAKAGTTRPDITKRDIKTPNVIMIRMTIGGMRRRHPETNKTPRARKHRARAPYICAGARIGRAELDQSAAKADSTPLALSI